MAKRREDKSDIPEVPKVTIGNTLTQTQDDKGRKIIVLKPKTV